jgi:branched-chain amino acid transport system permease protein
MILSNLSMQALSGQLVLGLVNGAFYATLSLGLSVIFGMLNIVNFAHGAFFMLGAYVGWIGLTYLGIGYWETLLLTPLLVGAVGLAVERTLLQWLYRLDNAYGLLLTFGLSLVIEGIFRDAFGASGQTYQTPELLEGSLNLGFMRLPIYRAWILFASASACGLTWYMIERTKLGAYLRAATENPDIVNTMGINVPMLVSLTYVLGVALAAFAGVLAAPVMQINPLMGANIIITVFAVVVIGGMGSIAGSIATGLSLGLLEGVAKIVYPQIAATIVFIAMTVVLLILPAGIFGKETKRL